MMTSSTATVPVYTFDLLMREHSRNMEIIEMIKNEVAEENNDNLSGTNSLYDQLAAS